MTAWILAAVFSLLFVCAPVFLYLSGRSECRDIQRRGEAERSEIASRGESERREIHRRAEAERAEIRARNEDERRRGGR
jgi:C4-dicarboxylate-specific signal transduction histidine kinase